MSGELSAIQRAVVARLAAEILPGTNTQPAAVEIGIENTAIDRALRSRPDLVPDFCRLLDTCAGNPGEFLQGLGDVDFDTVMTVICAAYVMEARVCKALGYDGQQALTPNRGGFGAEDLVLEMLQRPKRYRRV